ncbi:exosome complex exonuclease Rrp41 [Candidatus Woesearchaeota archaeon]|nr:exosome complex exonuclease Rrp41 [Candidatus Woesearchaeota archaeon]
MAVKRSDGRKWDELRPMEAKVGVIPRADGSALFKIGNTHAIAAVYGPRELHPKFLQNPEKGILRVNYNMLSFSGVGERVRPGPNRRSREISLVAEKALLPVLNLNDFPNAVVDVFIELLQTDAGTRCAGITAASLALADAGLMMKDLITAVSVGFVDDQLLLDINADEDCGGATDIPIAIMPRTKELTLLQMDGLVKKEQLKEALKVATEACAKIYEVQKKALKEKYAVK